MTAADEIYEELKLLDRITPGRTPWQTLRRRADEQARAAEQEEKKEARQLADAAREFAHEQDGESGLFCHACGTVWNRLGGIRRLADLDCVACPAIYSSVARNEEG